MTDPTPITTLDALDEALAELREPKPEPVVATTIGRRPYWYSPSRAWFCARDGVWFANYHPTRSPADTLALLEWYRNTKNGGIVIEDDMEWRVPFPIAASVAVARACGLRVELD